MKQVFLWSAALLLATGGVIAADKIKSGLQPGAKAGAFNVQDCTGPNKGKKLCYRWRYGKRPVVTIFAREITGNLTSLVKQIDKVVGENKSKKMAAFVVLLSDDPDAAEPKLKKLAAKHDIQNTPLTIFDGVTGPKKYKVAKDADVTVLMWVKHTVKVNHAFKKGELKKDAVAKVVADTSKILGVLN